MATHQCPWWLGYALVNPLRRLYQDPAKITGPFIGPGAKVLEIGPGMGFFTIPMARMVRPGGTVYALDVQEKMLAALGRRAVRAGVAPEIETILVGEGVPGPAVPGGSCSFALAFAVVHEVDDQEGLFAMVHHSLSPGGRLLLAEPKGHVSEKDFIVTIEKASAQGLVLLSRPAVPLSRAVLMEKRPEESGKGARGR